MRNKLFATFFALVLAMGAFAAPALADNGDNSSTLGAATLDVAKATGKAESKKTSQTSISKSKVVVKAQLFTGKSIAPNIKVFLGNKKLVKGRDYKTGFKNNVNPGKASVTISGKGKYKGQKTVTFQIKTKKGLKIVGGSAYFFKNTKGVKATGWVKSGSKWYWGNSKGKLASGWKKVAGKWYYFDIKNYAMKTGWQKISGEWYYFYDSGEMAKSAWVGDYYLKSNGVMATSQWIGDYWVDSSGKWTDTRSDTSSDTDSDTVYITRTGAKFHNAGCRWLYASQIPISRSEAESRGYEPCKVCNP